MTGGAEPHALTSTTVLRVAVDVPGAPGERLYDYLALDGTHAAVGDGVIVPFGVAARSALSSRSIRKISLPQESN